MIVQELNRIFDRDDVVAMLAVDSVEQRRQGGRLAGGRGAGDEHNAIAHIGHFVQLGRQVKRSEIRNGCGNNSHDHGTAAALNENIHAKARQARDSKGHVSRSLLTQGGYGLLVSSHQVGGDAARVIRAQRMHPVHLHRHQLPMDLDLRRASGRENEVADLA